MSKTNKRVAVALVLLCLLLGGTALYRRATGSSQEAKQAAAGQPSTPIAPAPAPAPAPSPAPAAVEPVAPPGDRAAATAAGSGNDEERGRASGAPREERRSHRGKALAMEEPTPATSESQTPTVAAPAEPAPATSESQTPTVAAPAEPPMPQHRRGNVAIEVRPKLGNAVQSFEIVKVAASVDGYEVSALDGKSFGPHRSEVEAWNGTIDAGEHVLNVVVEYHGNGHGVFSYFDGYRYTARSSTHFRLDEGARLQMMVDLIDKGGVNTAFDKRLAIAFAAKP